MRTEKSGSAAVNLNQFRNTEVGQGYQAKHVVRQPSMGSDKVNIVDQRQAPEAGETCKDRTYLRSSALRRFRMELEKFK